MDGSAAPPGPRAARLRPALAAFGLFLVVAGLFQLLTPVPWDADTAYHVAVARLIAREGILRSFPWTPFSWLSTNYADKELLFHLLLAPLAAVPWIAAAKIAGTVLGGTLLLVLYLVLRAERVPRALAWALVPLAASGAFVVRFALVRPHLLSVALALAVAWAAARERHRLLAAASFLYPWCYVAWPTPIALVALAELARALSGRGLRWRPAAVTALSVAAGVALHPNAANLVRFSWLVHVDILLRGAWSRVPGFELGTEFLPFRPADALRYLLVPAVLLCASAVMGWRERARDSLPLSLALTAAAYGALTLGSQRFVEYFAPFATAAFATALAGTLRERAERWGTAVLAGAFAFTAAFGAGPVVALGTRGDDIPPRFTSFLRARIPPGEQVFTCDWGLTGELLLALPGRRFVVALDPTLFHARDPELYQVWVRLPREGAPDARRSIRERFGARWVICLARPESEPLFRRLRSDPAVTPLLESRLWMVYDLGEPL